MYFVIPLEIHILDLTIMISILDTPKTFSCHNMVIFYLKLYND